MNVKNNQRIFAFLYIYIYIYIIKMIFAFLSWHYIMKFQVCKHI